MSLPFVESGPNGPQIFKIVEVVDVDHVTSGDCDSRLHHECGEKLQPVDVRHSGGQFTYCENRHVDLPRINKAELYLKQSPQQHPWKVCDVAPCVSTSCFHQGVNNILRFFGSFRLLKGQTLMHWCTCGPRPRSGNLVCKLNMPLGEEAGWSGNQSPPSESALVSSSDSLFLSFTGAYIGGELLLPGDNGIHVCFSGGAVPAQRHRHVHTELDVGLDQRRIHVPHQGASSEEKSTLLNLQINKIDTCIEKSTLNVSSFVHLQPQHLWSGFVLADASHEHAFASCWSLQRQAPTHDVQKAQKEAEVSNL